MTRNEVKLLALIALFVALTAARIVNAQETLQTGVAGVSPPVEAGTPSVQSAVGTTSPDSAQGVRASVVDDATVLVLAMAMVAESGFDAATDHAAIAHVMARKAERHGVPLVDMLVRYVALFRVEHPSQPWVLDLRLDASKPNGWPSNLAWSAYAERWVAVIDRARTFVAGRLADPCGSAVEHWGGPRIDTPRGRMQIAACSGLTRNTYYTLRARR